MARTEALHEHGVRARIIQERISRELAELKGTHDRRRLSELYIIATTSVVGMGQLISEDEDIERIESETPEELAEEHAMWDALQELAEVANAVEAELYQVDDSQGVDNTLSAAQKKATERWFGSRKAS
jgi:hypothetical protein